MSSGSSKTVFPRFHKEKEEHFYMSVAREAATMSHAVRNKVGACVVTSSGAMFYGYNGTPAGRENCCEIEVDGALVTKQHVVHAEVNALAKAAREGVSTVGSIVYVTLSPCVPCATILASFGVKGVVFDEFYRDGGGIIELADSHIPVRKYLSVDQYPSGIIPLYGGGRYSGGSAQVCAGRVCC